VQGKKGKGKGKKGGGTADLEPGSDAYNAALANVKVEALEQQLSECNLHEWSQPPRLRCTSDFRVAGATIASLPPPSPAMRTAASTRAIHARDEAVERYEQMKADLERCAAACCY
jgi:hypothetical protein